MTHLDQMIADALAQSRDTVVHQLASEVVRLRGAITDALRPLYEGGHIYAKPLEEAIRGSADLKRGGVVVPDEDVEFRAKVILDEWDCGNLVSRGAWMHGDAFDELRKALSASRPRTIPADRELMRLVDELIRWHGLRPLDKRPDHAAALVGAIKALRAQPTQELAP